MSSIIREGDTFHGISVEGRGVFKHKYGETYAGQCRDGYACGLGVATYSNGSKDYAEHGPDGQCDGRCLGRHADGHTFYVLFERGKPIYLAIVYASGRCTYNTVDCAQDDPRLIALILLVARVEVRPAAPAPTRQSPPTRPRAMVRSAGSVCCRRSRTPWPPRCTSTPQASACPGGRVAQPNGSHNAQNNPKITCN
jgi:hypothetical protein